MYLIAKETNTITALTKKTFSELGFRERSHLQEWLAANPESLGEKLLVIQKEFNGFADTNERLDLLALDGDGNIVIIENKLDDSGRDVTWQAMKYASYASTLTNDNIRTIYQSYLDSRSNGENAIEKLEEFFDDTEYADLVLNQHLTQRIIMVAANFRKEVTSTALWLMNFKIRIKCFKVTVHELGSQHFLSLEQIIPTKDTQEYVISMANKVQEELSTEGEVKNRYKQRLEFWGKFLKEIKGKSELFQNSNPVKDHWLSAGTGISNVVYQIVLTKTDASILFRAGRGSQAENKLIYDTLILHKTEIEKSFSSPLKWERMEDNKISKVSYYKTGVNYYNSDEWQDIIIFLIEFLNRLEKAIKPHLGEVKKALINLSTENHELTDDLIIS